MNAGGVPGRTPRERLSRSEPFEVFTRPQRSLPSRLVGLVIRLRAELLVLTVALTAWSWLTQRMPVWLICVLLGVIVVAAGAWSPARRYVVRRGYAVETRHRLRAVFVERRVMNYSGNLPLILWSRPTVIGERVWLLLRAGIDAHDVELNLTDVAAGCWARDARVAPHRKVSTLVVLDVIRRDPLTGPAVPSPHGVPVARRRLNPVPPVRVGGEHSA